MVAILTTAELKTHVETDLAEAALQRILDGLDAEIIARAGALGSQVARVDGFSREIVLPRAAATLTSVVESGLDGTTLALAADDYSLWPSGQAITRLSGGTNSAVVWARSVTVTYTPVDDLARRRVALIDLAKLELQFNGLSSERVGDYSSEAAKHSEARESIFRSLMPRRGWGVA